MRSPFILLAAALILMATVSEAFVPSSRGVLAPARGVVPGRSTSVWMGAGDPRSKRGKRRRKARGKARPKVQRPRKDLSARARPASAAAEPAPAAEQAEPTEQPATVEEAAAPEAAKEEAAAEAAGADGPESIVAQVSSQMKTAMKAREMQKLTALRGIKAALTNAAKETGAEELSDEDAVACLRKQAKMRKESIEGYEAAGAEDRAEGERMELAIIEQWLPQLATEDQVREWATAAIAQTGASGPQQMGAVMGVLMKDHKDDMDGKMAQQVVQELLRGMA